MKFLGALFIVVFAATLGQAQNPPVPSPATPTNAAPTNAAPQLADTNQVQTALIQQLIDKIGQLESRASQESDQSDKLKTQLFEAESKLERVREAEAASRSTFYVVLILAVGLAAVSIVGLLVFCFYTMRRVTEMSAPTMDSLHLQRHAVLPPATHPGAFLPAPIETNPATAVTRANENRLLDVVDRLERKIEEIEKAAHHDNHVHVPFPVPVVPAANSNRNHQEVDRLAVLLSKGEAHTNLQEFAKAIDCFEQAISISPNDPHPVVKKGYVLEKLGRIEEAMACYDKALQLDPNHSMAYLFKGGMLNRLQKYTEAIQCYDRALGGKPSGADR